MGNLTISQRYIGDGSYVDDANVILIGNGVSLHWTDPDQKEWISGEDQVRKMNKKATKSKYF